MFEPCHSFNAQELMFRHSHLIQRRVKSRGIQVPTMPYEKPLKGFVDGLRFDSDSELLHCGFDDLPVALCGGPLYRAVFKNQETLLHAHTGTGKTLVGPCVLLKAAIDLGFDTPRVLAAGPRRLAALSSGKS